MKYIFCNEHEFRTILSETIKQELENTKPVETKNDNDLITRKEVSILLNISLPTLNVYSRKGLLKSYRMGSRVFYKRNEVMDSLKEVELLKYR